MKVYFISGLGADSRVFHHIRLPEGYEAEFITWIQPRRNEPLHDYAMRLAGNIDRSKPFVLVGLSLGGMLATEIARNLNADLTILISSIPCAGHLPSYYRIAAKMRLHKLVPIGVLKSGSFLKRFFTKELSEDKQLIRQLIKETDPAFIRWALQAIVEWRGEIFQGRYVHIHGSGDEILPVRYTRPTHVIQKASHMMILTHAAEINRILREVLINR